MPEPRYETLFDVNEWFVHDHREDDTWLEGFTEAEAKIIVFALNAVAKGNTLAQRWESAGNWGYADYDGPTEGVAS